jgi:fatty acid/phospholipid biosynthesis enzyme
VYHCRRGKRTVLCQVGVEITSKSEQLQKFAIIGAFAALGVGAVISSVLYQPIQ